MKTIEEKRAAAKSCFDYNTQANIVFVAGDLNCFFNRSDAVNHARGLSDTSMEVFERDGDEVTNNTDKANSSTADANTQPDAKLASQQANGDNLSKRFPAVKPGGNAAEPNTTEEGAGE